MNTKLLLLVVSIATFSSCTTLYKSGQTPDDVYYSPVRPAGYSEEKQDQRNDDYTAYNTEDRVIRMGINDYRWRTLDYGFTYNSYFNDFSYSPYSYGYNPYCYGCFDYGYYYNPYYYPYPVYNSVVYVKPYAYNPKVTTPRVANLGAYNPIRTTGINTNHGAGRPMRTYNNTNNGSAVGNVLRQILTPSNTNNSSSIYNNNSSNNTRSYTPSSSSSSAGRSSSSGGGGVSRPPRN